MVAEQARRHHDDRPRDRWQVGGQGQLDRLAGQPAEHRGERPDRYREPVLHAVPLGQPGQRLDLVTERAERGTQDEPVRD